MLKIGNTNVSYLRSNWKQGSLLMNIKSQNLHTIAISETRSQNTHDFHHMFGKHFNIYFSPCLRNKCGEGNAELLLKCLHLKVSNFPRTGM